MALAIHSALPTYAYYSQHLGTRGNYLQAPGNHLQARELYFEARGAYNKAREAFIVEVPNPRFVESKEPQPRKKIFYSPIKTRCV